MPGLARSNTGKLIRLADGRLRKCGSCCGDACILYWRADPCTPPEDLPTDCRRDPPGDPIWIRVGTLCHSILGDGDEIGPGDVVVDNDFCFTVIDEQRHKPGPDGAGCDPAYEEIPDGDVIIEGPTIECEAGCTSDRCKGGFFNYGPLIKCNPGAANRYVCRDGITDCGVLSDTPGCYRFTPDLPHYPGIPDSGEIVPAVSYFDSCCECGSAEGGACGYIEYTLSPQGVSIDPPLTCCCGSESANAACLCTLNVSSYTNEGPGTGGVSWHKIVVDLDPAYPPPEGHPGDTLTVHLRQRIWDDGVLVETDYYTESLAVPECGYAEPQFNFQFSDGGAGWTVTLDYSCWWFNRRDAYRDTDTGAEVVSVWEWSRDTPTVTAPCLGDCTAGSRRFRSIGPGSPPAIFRAL